MTKKIYLTLILLVTSLCSWAQTTYPVQVNANLIPPYSLYLDDYASGMRERISVMLINRDLQFPSMDVRLKMTVKANGFELRTNDYAVLPPIILEPGVPYRLSGDELAAYFAPQNLTASGMGSSAYQKDRKLPEGMIQFCFEVFSRTTGQKLSLPGCGTAWINTQKPPRLSLPFDNETVDYRDPLNLLFQWTPQHSGLANIEYELIIKQLWDNGLKPEAAWAYSTEIVRETVKPSSFLYGAVMPPLTPGMRYAWAVRAVAKEGLDEIRVFENNGLSEIRSFTLAEYCPPPLDVMAKTDNGRISLAWTPLPEHLGFMVSYRQKDKADAEWFVAKTNEPSINLYDVRSGFTYEYRIGALCKPEMPIYGQTYTITIPAADTGYNAACGKAPEIDLTNKNPLPVLEQGEIFMAGDFPVHVTYVTGSNGNFTGEGYTIMPDLFTRAKLRVKFSNISINTDRRMVQGWVDAVYDESESQVIDIENYFSSVNDIINLIGKPVEHIYDIAINNDITEDILYDSIYNEIQKLPNLLEELLVEQTDISEKNKQAIQDYIQELRNTPDTALAATSKEIAKELAQQKKDGELTKESASHTISNSLLKYNNPITINWKPVDPPQLLAAKKELKYIAEAGYEEPGKERTSFFKLEDGTIIARYQDPAHKYETQLIYKIQIQGDKKWYEFDIHTLTDDCKSCELTNMLTGIYSSLGKTTGRFLLIEEGLILVTGEDFDGVESSRLAASGWIVAAIAGGKIFKVVGNLTKEAYIAAKTTINETTTLYKLIKGTKGIKAVALSADELAKVVSKYIGLSDEAAKFSVTSPRFDHAIRHLIEEGIVKGTANSKLAREHGAEIIQEVVTKPLKIFDYFLQGAKTTGYYKIIDGKDVVVFVTKQDLSSKIKAGHAIGAWVPTWSKNPDIMSLIK